MIALPREPARRHLRAFGLVLAAAVGATAALLVPAGPVVSVLIGGAAALAAGLAGWAGPHGAEVLYGTWNRLADLAGRAAGRWLAAVIFFVLVTAVSRGGSRMPLSPGDDASGWTPRPARGPSHGSQHGGSRAGTSGAPWHRSLTAWARDSGNYWAVGLLPLLGLLRLLRPRAERSLGENIYTLY